MPTSPKKRPTHAARVSKNRSGDPFYSSKSWLQLRALKLSINPLCEHCRKQGRTVAASVVDHKQPRCDAPELELDLDNLQSLCESHHNAKTAREQNERRAPGDQ